MRSPSPAGRSSTVTAAARYTTCARAASTKCFANARDASHYGLPEVVLDGVVEEAHPPFKLVHTLRFLFTDANKAEGFTRITWEIAPTQSGFCRLTVIHEVEGAPMMAAATDSQFNEQGAGGWTWVISDLKSLLETGKPLAAAEVGGSRREFCGSARRRIGAPPAAVCMKSGLGKRERF